MEFAPAIVKKLREQAQQHAQLTESLAQPEIAGNPRRMSAVLRELGSMKSAAELAARLDSLIQRRQEAERLLEDADEEMRELAQEELDGLVGEEQAFDAEAKRALVAEADDERDKVIVEVRAGTGGDEATLFVGDLFRIYQRFTDAHKFKLEVLESTTTEVGGFKEIIFAVKGARAWARLRFESGGHRVQRVPATEAQGRIHTSAATVAVLPEAEEVDLEIATEDLRIDTMRASGAGGQHVNKTESAVRITHLPTSTVVVCMDEKSQHKNRQRAMRILRSRLLEVERARQHAERAALRKSQVGSGDRSARIRTYNWPQNRMTDHRLGENFSLEQILAGKLDPVFDGLEAMDREERISNL